MLIISKAIIFLLFVSLGCIIGTKYNYGIYGLLIGGFLGLSAAVTYPGILRLLKRQVLEKNLKILDTSVIIDGRIADVCESGFFEGVFIVPQFILQEIQYLGDSADPIKRARGRRGVDIIQRLQKMPHITVKITDKDFPNIKEVDAKLVALAKLLGAKVITSDFNLKKVAELQGVSAVNINELATALKPVVLPGETINVFVLKGGKEYNQGVAYLDDGTMVVVENGRRLIGKKADVTITNVLQTPTGRMIFSKPKEEYERKEHRVIK